MTEIKKWQNNLIPLNKKKLINKENNPPPPTKKKKIWMHFLQNFNVDVCTVYCFQRPLQFKESFLLYLLGYTASFVYF